MTLLLKQIFGFLKLLNSDTGTNQLASGIACGLILGFAPAFSLQTVLVIICLFFFRIQIGAATLAAFFFAFPAYLFDPLFHKIGVIILEQDSLQPLFTTLYNMPIVPFTKFYNTVYMGAGVTSILLFPIVFLLSKKLIIKYRQTVVARFQATKFWKVVQATKFYKWYVSYDNIYGTH
jgi:uncharacterized protein (TIGR03546 family)